MNRRLRVGLLIDSGTLAAWERRLVARLREEECAELVAVVVCAPPPAPRPGRLVRLWRARRYFLRNLYVTLDERAFRGRPDAFEAGDAAPLLEGLERVEARPEVRDGRDHVDAATLERVRGLRLDVLVRLGKRLPGGAILGAARYGVWSHHHSGNPRLSGELSGLWELLEGQPTTGSMLLVLSDDASGGRPIYVSRAATDHIALWRSRNRVYWKTANFVPRKLREIARDGEAALEPRYRPDFTPAPPRATNLRMLLLLARLVGRYARHKLRDALSREQWYLAYRFEEGPGETGDTFVGLTDLMPPDDRFWADPFPFRRDGRHYVFLEELIYGRPHAHLSVVELHPERGPGEPVRILERDHHLSYPLVFEWEGETYLMPEMSAARKVALFRCVEWPHRWEEDRVLLDDVDAVDATIQEIDGRWWMFVNIGAFGARNWDELHVYHASTPLGPWTAHPENPVKSDCRSARPAGRAFRFRDQLYRPAQNCAGTYGAAIALNRIVELTPERYREEHVVDIHPDWDPRARRTHTMNRCEGLLLVDILRRLPRFW